MVTNSPVFVSNDDNLFFTSTGHKLISHPLVRYIEKAKEIITSTGDLMGGPEHPYLKISLYIRLFQIEIILLVPKSSGSPVSLSEESKGKVFFSEFQERFSQMCQEM